jgi:hypothetical protein
MEELINSLGNINIERDENAVAVIIRWWRGINKPASIYSVYNTLKNDLTLKLLYELSNMCISVQNHCCGDGSGLLSGSLIDMVISSFLKQTYPVIINIMLAKRI